MSGDDNILKMYFDGVTQRIQAEIDYLNNLIGHAGEKGYANEQALANLLTKFLPKRYSIGSGIIIDSKGNRSKQVYTIVYDSYFHPELFAQGATVLFPVDVVYLVIEVKTILNKNTMTEAINNIASVKRLSFIPSTNALVDSSKLTPDGKGSFLRLEKTRPPMGVIFGYKVDTRVFNTYASWVAYMLDFPKNEMPELIYALETTFFHTFPCVDSKDELQKGKGIYHLHNGDNKVIEAEPPEYKNPTDSRIYPVIQAGEKNYVVEPARGFLNFLKNVYHLLSIKSVIQTSIFSAYMSHSISDAFNFY
ncbi:MAG TPA: DUF6602 domain-containing protein [Nitrososphaera sp.]